MAMNTFKGGMKVATVAKVLTLLLVAAAIVGAVSTPLLAGQQPNGWYAAANGQYGEIVQVGGTPGPGYHIFHGPDTWIGCRDVLRARGYLTITGAPW
jgi:hypothetical protein